MSTVAPVNAPTTESCCSMLSLWHSSSGRRPQGGTVMSRSARPLLVGDWEQAGATFAISWMSKAGKPHESTSDVNDHLSPAILDAIGGAKELASVEHCAEKESKNTRSILLADNS